MGRSNKEPTRPRVIITPKLRNPMDYEKLANVLLDIASDIGHNKYSDNKTSFDIDQLREEGRRIRQHLTPKS